MILCISLTAFGCASSYKPVVHPAIATTSIALEKAEVSEKPKIALVLGSGGARGYAHIGAIQMLEQQGIKPDFIVACSAGSIVGALYASGKTGNEIEKIAMEMKPSDVRDFTLSLQGFLDGKKIQRYINNLVDDKNLEQLDIPLYVVATELSQGKQVIFAKGDTGQAVRASTTIPSMFIPTKIGDTNYVDGGLISPLPVKIAKDLGADVVIAVDILARPQHTKTTNMWGLFNQNINVMQAQLSKNESQWADVVIQPDIREKAHIFSTKSRDKVIEAGRQAVQVHTEQLAQLKLQAENFQVETAGY